MGQYYSPVIIEIDEETNEVSVVKHWDSFDYGVGCKLMEHSWRQSNFMSEIMNSLYHNPQRLVWAGDYASYVGEADRRYKFHKIREMLTKSTHIKTDTAYNPRVKYIRNPARGEFVNIDKMPKDRDGWRMHPLSLLVTNSGDFGGGDYSNTAGTDYIGRWCGDEVYSDDTRPTKSKGWTEIFPGFVEV